MAANRETARDVLQTLLAADLVGTGKPAKQVVGHKVGKSDLDAGSPLVAVLSAGTAPTRKTYQGSFATFKFEIHTLVLSVDTNWTEAQAEDRLDLIESTIRGTVDAYNNGVKSNGMRAVALGESSVDEVSIGGKTYLLEITPCVVEMNS